MKLGEDGKELNIGVIPTGALPLDAALGIGGVPRGRIIEVYGPESSGKTTLALQILAEAQAMGGHVAFIDAEHALDPVYAARLGVDIDEVLISQPDTGEQALEICDMLVRSGAIDAVVVDSVAALVPRAEIEGEIGDTTVGLQARLMSQALRKLAGSLSKSNTTCIFINQLREKIGVMFGNPETTTGGRALKVLLQRAHRHPPHRLHQEGRRDNGQPRARQGREEQGGPRRSSRPSSTSCTARVSRGKGASSTWRWRPAWPRRAARGTPTARSAWARAARRRSRTLKENPDLREEIELKVREAFEIPVITRTADEADAMSPVAKPAKKRSSMPDAAEVRARLRARIAAIEASPSACKGDAGREDPPVPPLRDCASLTWGAPPLLRGARSLAGGR